MNVQVIMCGGYRSGERPNITTVAIVGLDKDAGTPEAQELKEFILAEIEKDPEQRTYYYEKWPLKNGPLKDSYLKGLHVNFPALVSKSFALMDRG